MLFITFEDQSFNLEMVVTIDWNVQKGKDKDKRFIRLVFLDGSTRELLKTNKTESRLREVINSYGHPQ